MGYSEDNTQAPAPQTRNVLSLPEAIRNDIYRRVLVVKHPIYIFQDTGSKRVESFAPDRPARCLALLYANRQIRDEATAVLYGQNSFTFMDTSQHQADLLGSFFDRIGEVNAAYITRICINFPVAEKIAGPQGRVVLGQDDMRSLELLQRKCANVQTLEAIVQKQNSKGLTVASEYSTDAQAIREQFSEIDAQLKALPALRKVVVRFYNGCPTPEVTKLMEGLGWSYSFGP